MGFLAAFAAFAAALALPAGAESLSPVKTAQLSAALYATGIEMGDPLLILEAMKMEHVLTAPRDGMVAEVLVGDRDQVSDGTLLLRLEVVDG